MHYPRMSLIEELCHRQQVVEAQAVGLLPGLFTLLVAAAGDDAVPGALLAVVTPDGDLQNADAYFVCWFRHDVGLLLLGFRLRSSGPYGSDQTDALAGL